MLVKDWMDKKVVSIDAEESMSKATKLLKANNIQLLPVLMKDKLVGVVTDRDLKRASASDATTLEIHELLYLLTKIKVKTLMSAPPITVPDDYTIEETAEVLMQNKISGVPVVNAEDEVVGLITQGDIFRSLIGLTGVNKRGVLFAFMLDNQAGTIQGLLDIMREYGGRTASILSSYEDVINNSRKAYIRTYGIDRTRLKSLQERLSAKAQLLYMIDHRENIRQLF